jgi:ER lumen protein retaining receptor
MSMNIFRLCGDMSHVFSILVLLLRLRVAKNASGISLRTHELFLLVFLTRYTDLFTTYYSLYNSCMKVLYIASTASIVYSIRAREPICSTYDKSQDTFRHVEFAILPCVVLAILTHLITGEGRSYDLFRNLQEILWMFSIYLESIAILPQLIVLQRYREVENLTGNYIFFMGAYRALYIVNWVYRAYYEVGYRHHYVVYFCGVLQTLLYVDFFYYYFMSKRRGGRFSLPTQG